MAKPCTPHLITRKGYATSVRQQSCQRLCNPQAAQLFEPQTANVRGRGGRPLVLSLGGCKGGYSLSRKRVSPFYALPRGAGIVLLHQCRKKALLRLRRQNPFLCNQHRAAHIMLLDRHLGRHELLAADEHRRAVELRQQAVIVPAALTETAALAVERQAGHDGEVDVRRGDERAVLFRL